ncbi:MAG TPA: putative glycoside hydrolase, partial [Turneriella sp.]|nr:putative glycoside hydrolase [Turneriella sp.]
GGGKWIGSPKERWIDPYNPNLLTEYYGPIVRELTERGVDEIQLDYIRFPSDGAIGRCRYSHKKSDHYASEALENFLVGIRQQTHLPLGADIYGYNGMYRVPGAIGQDLEVYGRILDVISPMHYSSHFGDDYMREYARDDRAYQLLLLALSRGSFYAQGNFILRPYIQAFPMKNGLWGYGKKYFADQIKGSADGGGNGFMFWGQIDHMVLVRQTQSE